MKSYFNKSGGSFVPLGSLEFMFTRKCVFEFKMPAGKNIDDLELELIDAGLEEIETHKDITYAYADFTNFGLLHAAIEELGIEISKSDLQRFPNTPVQFTDEQMADIDKLIEKIEEDEDVQAVFTNIG